MLYSYWLHNIDIIHPLSKVCNPLIAFQGLISIILCSKCQQQVSTHVTCEYMPSLHLPCWFLHWGQLIGAAPLYPFSLLSDSSMFSSLTCDCTTVSRVEAVVCNWNRWSFLDSTTENIATITLFCLFTPCILSKGMGQSRGAPLWSHGHHPALSELFSFPVLLLISWQPLATFTVSLVSKMGALSSTAQARFTGNTTVSYLWVLVTCLFSFSLSEVVELHLLMMECVVELLMSLLRDSGASVDTSELDLQLFAIGACFSLFIFSFIRLIFLYFPGFYSHAFTFFQHRCGFFLSTLSVHCH